MIKIQKDGQILEVTVGTYKNLFKDMGYEVVGAKVVEKPVVKEVVEDKPEVQEEPKVNRGVKKDVRNKK